MSFKTYKRDYEGHEIMVYESITGYNYEISKDGKVVARSVVSYMHEKQAEITATWKVDSLIKEATVEHAEALINVLCQKHGYSVGYAKELIQQALNGPDFVNDIRESLHVTMTEDLNLLYQYACFNNDLPANYNPNR